MPSICIIIVLVLCENATNINGTENQVEYQEKAMFPDEQESTMLRVAPCA